MKLQHVLNSSEKCRFQFCRAMQFSYSPAKELNITLTGWHALMSCSPSVQFRNIGLWTELSAKPLLTHVKH